MKEVGKGHEERVPRALLTDGDAVTYTGQVDALGLEDRREGGGGMEM